MKTLFLALFLSSVASAGELVKTKMLADVDAIAPGATFTVGVKVTTPADWHVYWINPGDTGIPTKVTLTAPEGFTVGEVQFPVPQKLDVPGGITAYGYENEVMLFATVTAPKELKEGSTATIRATTEWLVCNQDQCVPGKADNEMDLKVVSAEPKAINKAEFDKWRAQVPKETSDVQQEIQVDAPNGQFKSATGKLVMNWKQTPEKVQWFPAPPEQLMVTSSDVKTENGKSIVTFKVEPLAGEKVANPSIFSVLGYRLNGQRLGVAVPISLHASEPKGN
jgi:DsbC/DsbD-like thiol-disulfide interchange protein